VTRTGRLIVLALVMAVGVALLAAAQSTKPAAPAKPATPTQAAAASQPADPLPRTETRERNLRAYVELLRSDLRTQKVAVITELMQFTDADDAVFWPIYREYELDLSRLNDGRLRLIETYAKSYTKLTSTIANDLMVKALELEAQRTALKQKYYGKLKTVVSPVTAARAVQIENQIQLLIDLQIAASLPVAQ
jgi:hypothetical protein